MNQAFFEAEFHLNQGENALGLLNPSEREDARRLLAICQNVWINDGADTTTTREVGRLVELLARRSARAMPFAALGRALLAGLHGSTRDRDSLLAEFQTKLTMLGL